VKYGKNDTAEDQHEQPHPQQQRPHPSE
jgi:hypothetical protein